MKFEFSERIGIRIWVNNERAFEISLLCPKGASWKQRLFGCTYHIKDGVLVKLRGG